jgi:uncharacterized protein
MKKIAVIGSGITGVATSYYLNQLGYEVHLFEAGSYFGGHTHTHKISFQEKEFSVDTGFLVHNDRTYPNLVPFLKGLGIEVHYSDMSFSVIEDKDNIAWAGTNLLTLFGQYKNILSPRFYKFVAEILHFNKRSGHYLEQAQEDHNFSLGDLLDQNGYSEDFKRWYLLPMGGCIWSTPVDKMLSFPAHSFLRFCRNHGLLQISDRPQWKTIVGGCRQYVDKALSGIKYKYLNEPVASIMPFGKKVLLKTLKRQEEFDSCFMCCHPPESLKMIRDASEELIHSLSQFSYQKNTAVLHHDHTILPEERFWSAWNYRSGMSEEQKERVSVSYLINKLQPLPIKDPVIVTLNPIVPIDPDKVWKTIEYEHPIFNSESVRQQSEIMKWQGEGNLYFSGAWMRYGFHEDGILSAKLILNHFLEKEDRILDKLEIYE